MRILKRGEVKIACTTCKAELAIEQHDVQAQAKVGRGYYAVVKCACCGSATEEGIPNEWAERAASNLRQRYERD